MSIDEAIRQFKYDAECNRADLDLSYAEDNEQIAEWLEELKSIKDGSIPIIHGKAELELHDKKIYNKALDEFIYNIKPRMEWDNQFYALAIEHCIKIAERLKEQKK